VIPFPKQISGKTKRTLLLLKMTEPSKAKKKRCKKSRKQEQEGVPCVSVWADSPAGRDQSTHTCITEMRR
jgi:hypothetical protein